jgi:hypothetical protein
MARDTFRYCLKIETDKIAATTVPVMVLYDPGCDKLWLFSDHPTTTPMRDGLEIALLADELVVHSTYSLTTLERLYGVTFDRNKVVDALKMAEMVRGKGGNAIAKWAERLKIARDPFKGAEHWSPTVQRHAERDARIIACVLENLLQTVDARQGAA